MDPYLTKNIVCVQLSGRVVRYTSNNTTPPGEASSVSITISASFEVQKRVFSFLRSFMVCRSGGEIKRKYISVLPICKNFT